MAHQHATVWASTQLPYPENTRFECTYTRGVSLSFGPKTATLVLASLVSRSVLTISFGRAQWGFHPGGWGKPPLDEYNRPLYGDVFGVLPKATDYQEVRNVLLASFKYNDPVLN